MGTIRIVVSVIAVTIFAACCVSSSPTTNQSDAAAAYLSTICGATAQPSGSRVRVSGFFGGFGYDTHSMLITLEDGNICNENGAGLVFARLANEDERQKVYNTQAKASVVVEGIIDKVEHGRFVYLTDVDVVRAN